MRNLLSLTVACIAVAVFAVSIPPTNVTLTFNAVVDGPSMGGLTPNDYATNFVLLVRQSADASIPTNQWAVTFTAPATQFTNQGPFGSDWSVVVPTSSNPSFFLLQFSNYAGGVGPFSTPASWVQGAPPGQIKKLH